jgi:hypothetical protein
MRNSPYQHDYMLVVVSARTQGLRHSCKFSLHSRMNQLRPDQCGLCTGSEVVFLVFGPMVRKPTMTNFEVFHGSHEVASPVAPQHLLTEFLLCDRFEPNCSLFVNS